MRCWTLTLALLAAVWNPGCGNPDSSAPPAAPLPAAPAGRPQPALPQVRLWLGTEELLAEVATDDRQRMAGMMFRTNMAENAAMLFVFPYPHRTAFWMLNTPLPLSAAYLDPDGVIREIHALQPHDTNSVAAASDRIQYVLETNQGWFDRHRVGVGALVRTEKGTLRQTFFPSR
jgi:hypothetical protein